MQNSRQKNDEGEEYQSKKRSDEREAYRQAIRDERGAKRRATRDERGAERRATRDERGAERRATRDERGAKRRVKNRAIEPSRVALYIHIGSIAIARTSTDPLFVCNAVRLSVCLSVGSTCLNLQKNYFA